MADREQKANQLEMEEKKHFVLVHGACHGAWCWYKVKPLLESSGHHVTALDMAASGIHGKAIQEVQTLAEYSQPLLEFLASLPQNERVILVGHSLGGLNLALAMEKFPHKIAVAVYVAAFMPDTAHPPSFVVDQLMGRTPSEAWLDTEFSPYSNSLKHLVTMRFGPKFVSSMLYQLCPIEDLELSKMLIRPSSLFLHDLSGVKNFTVQGYGSVNRVYIICEKDKIILTEIQEWMTANYPVKEIMRIQDSDHMPMLCKPKEFFDCLSKIANNYS